MRVYVYTRSINIHMYNLSITSLADIYARASQPGVAAKQPLSYPEPSRDRVLHWQPTGPNLLYHRDDLMDRPRAMGVWIPFQGSLVSTCLNPQTNPQTPSRTTSSCSVHLFSHRSRSAKSKSFCKSHIKVVLQNSSSAKIHQLFLYMSLVKGKLKDSWGSWLLQNDFENTLCETNLSDNTALIVLHISPTLNVVGTQIFTLCNT